MITGADLEPNALVGSMSATPFTEMVAVETVGTSAVFGAAAFFAAEAVVCDFWSGGTASSRVPQVMRGRRRAGTNGRRGVTDSSIRKQLAANSSPEYHRLKWLRLDPHHMDSAGGSRKRRVRERPTGRCAESGGQAGLSWVASRGTALARLEG